MAQAFFDHVREIESDKVFVENLTHHITHDLFMKDVEYLTKRCVNIYQDKHQDPRIASMALALSAYRHDYKVLREVIYSFQDEHPHFLLNETLVWNILMKAVVWAPCKHRANEIAAHIVQHIQYKRHDCAIMFKGMAPDVYFVAFLNAVRSGMTLTPTTIVDILCRTQQTQDPRWWKLFSHMAAGGGFDMSPIFVKYVNENNHHCDDDVFVAALHATKHVVSDAHTSIYALNHHMAAVLFVLNHKYRHNEMCISLVTQICTHLRSIYQQLQKEGKKINVLFDDNEDIENSKQKAFIVLKGLTDVIIKCEMKDDTVPLNLFGIVETNISLTIR